MKMLRKMFLILLCICPIYTQSTPYQNANAGDHNVVRPRAATVPHQATLYYQNSFCSTNNPCQLQVWRAVCPTATTCPSYVAGAPGWTRVTSGSGTSTPQPSGTTWTVVDQDAVLQDLTTYVYVATNSYVSAPTRYSDASPPWSGTTRGSEPATPTLGTGNSVD